MSYIDITGEKTKFGQYIEIAKNQEFDSTEMDILLIEGRVHLDSEDVVVLKTFLQREFKEEK